jgi:lipopolysaccharide export system protein LptC
MPWAGVGSTGSCVPQGWVGPLATLSTTGEGGARAYLTRGRSNPNRTFRVALRHSRRVRFLRLALPVGVLAAVLVYVALSWLNPLRLLTKLPVKVGNLVVSGTKITMESPKLAGYTRDARSYEMTARAAAQDITRPDKLELNGVHAKVEMQDHTMVDITAATGVYDSKNEMLTLKKDIVIKSTSGYEGYLSEAEVDIRNGHILSEKPVTVNMLNGDLKANRMEVLDAGDVVKFGGGIAMTVTASAPDDVEASADKP